VQWREALRCCCVLLSIQRRGPRKKGRSKLVPATERPSPSKDTKRGENPDALSLRFKLQSRATASAWVSFSSFATRRHSFGNTRSPKCPSNQWTALGAQSWHLLSEAPEEYRRMQSCGLRISEATQLKTSGIGKGHQPNSGRKSRPLSRRWRASCAAIPSRISASTSSVCRQSVRPGDGVWVIDNQAAK